jgi:hypothetical protein
MEGKFMTTKFWFAAVALAIVSILAGCSSTPSSQPTQAQLQAFTTPPQATAAQRAAGLQSQEAHIIKLHPELAGQGKGLVPPPVQ